MLAATRATKRERLEMMERFMIGPERKRVLKESSFEEVSGRDWTVTLTIDSCFRTVPWALRVESGLIWALRRSGGVGKSDRDSGFRTGDGR